MGNGTEEKRTTAERSGHIARPRFKKSYEEYTVFMPIAIPGAVVQDEDGNETRQTKHLKVGDTLKKGEIRLHVLRMFFLRGRIGPKDHPWTKRRLEKWREVDEQRQKERQEREQLEAQENAQRKVVEAAEAQEEAKRKLQEAEEAGQLAKEKTAEAEQLSKQEAEKPKTQETETAPAENPKPRRRGRPPKQ